MPVYFEVTPASRTNAKSYLSISYWPLVKDNRPKACSLEHRRRSFFITVPDPHCDIIEAERHIQQATISQRAPTQLSDRLSCQVYHYT